MIVLDTNVVSEMLRSRADSRVVEWLDRQRIEECYLTSVNVAELAYGVARLPAGRRRDALDAGLTVILEENFAERILPFDLAAARAYAVLTADRERRGRPISGFDGQIASLCWVHSARLATRNVRDFDGLDIEVVNPWA